MNNKNYIKLFNELIIHSYKINNIVYYLDNKNPRVFQDIKKWLEEIEELLKKNNSSKVLQFSSLRAKIISIELNKEINRKNRFKEVGESIYELKDMFNDIVLPIENIIEESKIIIKQILEYLYQLNKIPKKKKNDTFNSYIESIWFIIKEEKELKTAYVSLISKLSRIDINLLLAEEIKI